MLYEDFVPERLAKLRIQKGVSARDMSLSLGQANNYINNVENKKTLPSMQSFFYIWNPAALKEFITEAKKLDSKTMSYILGIMKELNSKK